jgi:hypothetical protein
LDVIETLLEHSLMEAHREMRRTREREKGGGEISSRNWRNKVKVRSLAFARKLGLILILSGASQHEKPCRSSTFNSEPRKKLRVIDARTYD